jgi:hypothetical protein
MLNYHVANQQMINCCVQKHTQHSRAATDGQHREHLAAPLWHKECVQHSASWQLVWVSNAAFMVCKKHPLLDNSCCSSYRQDNTCANTLLNSVLNICTAQKCRFALMISVTDTGSASYNKLECLRPSIQHRQLMASL